jgi:four helix bundle protein
VSKVKTHKNLEVWRLAIELAKDVYAITSEYPREESFGLVSQMRRAAVSVASNIAEGAARNGDKEFVRFLYVALGSASELDTHIEISRAVLLSGPSCLDLLQGKVARVAMLLSGLIRSVRQRSEQSGAIKYE